jgi:type II secretory ATPase GspE/PulE/Tfp pilus assembly ATPase PilB-like protein
MNAWVDQLTSVPESLREEARSSPDALTLLSDRGAVPVAELVNVAAAHYNVPGLLLGKYEPDPECVRLLSEEQARRAHALPLFRLGNHLYLAVADPDDVSAQDFVARITGLTVEPVLAHPKEIDQAITRWMLGTEQAGRIVDSIAAERRDPLHDVQEGPTMLEDREAPTIRLVDQLLMQAVRLGASDIHLEPFADKVLLRYRIDGVLREYPAPPKGMYAAVVSRIKISAALDIAERRLPQDGRSSLTVDGKKYDLRVSVIPNMHGEGIVIRVLNPYAIQLNLASLGFDALMQSRYEALLRRPYGIILVTGPTGSGKSTTLYATLNHISDERRKVITLEDPVEYQLPGITQIQLQPEIGYTFASGLRAILRHDPDVVLVGEIRDLESAEIAIRAALTGHQMFSTLHTNDAAQSITRLRDMGVPLYQIMASLNGALAQRLLRRLCPSCKRPEELPAEPAQVLGLPEGSPVFVAVGCAECRNLGYRGRVAVYELLEVTDRLRAVPTEEASPARLQQIALEDGSLLRLKDSAAAKVAQGMTSVEEALSLVVT